ncbi:MAG: lysine--tRNA ligase [Fimbriimonadaceae bacterium]
MSEASIREIRLEKLARLRELGHDPFSIEEWHRDFTVEQVLEKFEELSTEFLDSGKKFKVAGRIHSMRIMGKAAFADVDDGTARVQIYVKRDDVGDDLWEVFKLADVGDHIGVEGYPFITKTGEKSLHVTGFHLLSKALEPLPLGKEKDGHVWYGLADVEQRYRRRHLDLIANPESRALHIARMRMVTAVRHYLDSAGYLEVETPILQVVAGGAAARPFTTHYNAYEMDVKLRISLELYLKRLICADLPAVYEIGRVFRNEGVSNRHNPEFTMLEFYEAYTNLEGMMRRVEELFKHVCKEVFKTTKVTVGEHELDFSQPWKRLELLSALETYAGVKPEELESLDSAKKSLERCGISAENENNIGGIIEKFLEKTVEPTLVHPTFITGYPIETSPLAKKDPNRPGFTRRFEGYVLCREVCNAFSEINDPIDQRERFEMQLKQRELGDDEAHPMDEDFLYALECGMPPTGGCGIGIDRLVMTLTGAEHLREILLFPMMRPEEPTAEPG